MIQKVKVGFFLAIIYGFAFSFLLVSNRDVSKFERRKLVGTDELKSDFLSNLDEYMMDQFPLRDSLLKLSSLVDRKVFLNNHSKDVYLQDGYSIEANFPLDEKSVQKFIDKLSYIEDNYLEKSRVFYTIIPDKSYFQKEMKSDFSHMQNAFNRWNEAYINVFDLFSLTDYYRTDIHLTQPSYDKMVKVLSESMHFPYKELTYDENIKRGFYGSTYPKVPFIKPDDLTILENIYTRDAQVKHLEYGEKNVYDKEKGELIDGYDVFLSGASALVTIDYPKSESDRELIIFRDSFASSLAPLLIPYYKKITLIDLRYISIDATSAYVNYEGRDVLFMYSTLLVNNSDLLKVKIK